MGLPHYPELHHKNSDYQECASMSSQPPQVYHQYDQFPRTREPQIGLENDPIPSPYLRGLSGQEGQRPSESITTGNSQLEVQPRQAGSIRGHPQGNRQRCIPMDPRTSTSMTSHESARPRQPHSADILEASRMAYSAEALEESNPTESVQRYEQACAMFQEVIIKSSSVEERVKCNDIVSRLLSSRGRALTFVKADHLPSTSGRVEARVSRESFECLAWTAG